MQEVIDQLKLNTLWDDDYIKEDYNSNILIDLENPKRRRPLFNWCYYLIPKGSIFPLHKLLSDESWHYCLGGPVDLFLIKNGNIETVRIGPNIFNAEKLFFIVPNNTWFAATPALESDYTLVTHCVSPGWHPEDDIPGKYDEMIRILPDEPEFVKKYSWPQIREDYTNHKEYINF